MWIVSTLLQEPSRARRYAKLAFCRFCLPSGDFARGVRAGWEAMEEDVWGYPKLDDVLSLSWSNGRRRVRVPHTVANRYGIPVPAMTCHEEKTVKPLRNLQPQGAPWKTCTVWQEASTVPTKTPQNTTQTRRFLLNHNEAKALENQGKRCNHRCARWDSNPHDRSHRNLNPARLPITPLAHSTKP